MSFDGLVVRAVVHQLQSLIGGRLHKIHQPNETDLVLTIRANGATRKLLISANPTYPRFYITEKSYQNPLEAPMFCMLLRKHLENGVIESIEQVGLERIVHINFKQRDELGDMSPKRIVYELMGRHSNIILTDPETNAVLDGMKRVTPAISSHRIIVPGTVYSPPPEQHKNNPLEASEEEVAAVLSGAETDVEEAAKRLVKAYSGISPFSAKAIVQDAKRPAEAFAAAMKRVQKHEYFPILAVFPGGKPPVFSVLPFSPPDAETESFADVSVCLERFYGQKAEQDLVKQRSSDMMRLLQNEKQKNEKKLEKLNAALEDAKEAERYRMFGELLHTYMHTFRKGDRQAEVENYYDEQMGTVSIPLDPLLTPSENAQRYFRKYQKLKNSLSAVNEQIAQAKEEIQYLDTMIAQLDGATLWDIAEIRDELAEGGYLRHRGDKTDRRSKNGKPHLHAFVSSEGIPIYVGRNNTQNDYITNRLARSSDTWLHTKEIPGSHVVIRSDCYGDATLAEAANLAAYFSKARQSSLVPVDYTLVKYVKKPTGAKPGFVIYEKQKTLFITPDEQKVNAMITL